MVDTIEKTLNPVSLITFVLGFGILYPLGESKYRLSIFYLLIVWSVYAYAFYHATSLFEMKNVLDSSLGFFIVVVNLFVAIISIIIIFCKHKKYRHFIRKLSHVDDTLEKLGTSKEYHKMQHFIKQMLITWLLVTLLSWIFDSVLCATLYNDIKTIVVSWILNYFAYANTITDITFILLLKYIGSRLNKINDHIEQLLEVKDYIRLRCKWKKSLAVSNHKVKGAENHEHVLWTVIQLHLILNPKQIFEIDKILKIMLSDGTWFIVALIKFISLNYICESVSTKAQKTKDIIHKLTNLIYFVEVREEICQFVLQISLRPLKFSGLGLFYFGYSFIHKFFVWMITTIIFMTQMDFTSLW
ncbi:PREDICTED: uncharacterized protein LOC105459940 [Wasmannia auropunctata]|uniref:uncharacterized protein LOC105459940 n=1 Tax=Wasmannia auropunctata TaxID=64793 RepID=UPI0005EDA1E1|nr:PREDICTED: uncharacterized protein LOC105459940 [Wasmannia auropunctata]